MLRKRWWEKGVGLTWSFHVRDQISAGVDSGYVVVIAEEKPFTQQAKSFLKENNEWPVQRVSTIFWKKKTGFLKSLLVFGLGSPNTRYAATLNFDCLKTRLKTFSENKGGSAP